MAFVDQGGGGGRAGSDVSDNYALDKPYDLAGGEVNAEALQKIDEMFSLLFRSSTRTKAAVDSIVFPDASTGPWLSATITLTELQLEQLGTTPVTFLAAPGAGLVIVPLIMTGNWEVTAVYTNNPSFGTVYSVGGAGVAPTFSQTMNSTATGKKLMWVHSQTQVLYTPAGTYPENSGVQLQSSANLTGTGTIAAAGAVFNIVYTVLPIQ